MLQTMQKNQFTLTEELNRLRREHGVVTPSSSPIRAMPVTLSQELFSSQDQKVSMNDCLSENLPTTSTINPSSLSPELRPVSDSSEKAPKVAETKEQTATTSPDVTQHPAAMLCDLPCHILAELLQSFLPSLTLTQPVSASLPQLLRTLRSASANPSPSTPKLLPATSRANSDSLLPPRPLSTTTTWPVSTPRSSPTTCPTLSSSTSSSPMTPTLSQTSCQRATSPQRNPVSTANSSTLKIKYSQNILSSSPSLARPSCDATMAAMRLVTELLDDKVEGFNVESRESRGNAERARCLESIVASLEKVLTSTRGSLRFEPVTQNIETARTDVAKLRWDERVFSSMVNINRDGNVVRRLEMAKMGLWRFEESKVNVPEGPENQESVVVSTLRIQKPMAQPGDLHHLICSIISVTCDVRENSKTDTSGHEIHCQSYSVIFNLVISMLP